MRFFFNQTNTRLFKVLQSAFHDLHFQLKAQIVKYITPERL